MDEERAKFLRQAVEANPADAFARYALALELARSGRAGDAWPHFEYLLAHHPEYSATYYQAGMLLLDQGRAAEARGIFERGIEVTGREGNRHAQSELQAALDGLDE